MSSRCKIPAPEDPAFQLFPFLPIEMRLKIWKLSIPGPRILKIENSGFWNPKVHGVPFPSYLAVQIEGYSAPGMLSACYESRQVALKVYELAFGARLYGKPVWFDFQNDSLYFVDRLALYSFYGGWGNDAVKDGPCPADVVDFESKLKKVIVGGSIYWVHALQTLERLSGLESLILTTGWTSSSEITKSQLVDLLEDAWRGSLGTDEVETEIKWMNAGELERKFEKEKVCSSLCMEGVVADFERMGSHLQERSKERGKRREVRPDHRQEHIACHGRNRRDRERDVCFGEIEGVFVGDGIGGVCLRGATVQFIRSFLVESIW